MTEDDAKSKWCPFTRIPSNGLVANRDNPNDGTVTTIDDSNKCLASGCMAWRSGIKRYRDEGRGVDVEEPFGHCGLAGDPHPALAVPTWTDAQTTEMWQRAGKAAFEDIQLHYPDQDTPEASAAFSQAAIHFFRRMAFP